METVKINLFTGSKRRISKTNGCIETTIIDGFKCTSKTYIPNEPWKGIDNIEFKELKSKKILEYTDISLIKIPNKLVDEIKSLKITNCLNIKDISRIQESKGFKNLNSNILLYLSKFNLDGEINSHGIFFGKPDLKNITFNGKENTYIGMHLDSWEQTNIEERKFARNRVCINIGKESRYFLFYRIPIDKMDGIIREKMHKTYDVNEIYKQYASLYPKTPIYRLEVKPFEAYVAPTEYIIHDGSSEGSSYPDINLTYRGKFAPSQKTSLIDRLSAILKF